MSKAEDLTVCPWHFIFGFFEENYFGFLGTSTYYINNEYDQLLYMKNYIMFTNDC